MGPSNKLITIESIVARQVKLLQGHISAPVHIAVLWRVLVLFELRHMQESESAWLQLAASVLPALAVHSTVLSFLHTH